MKKILCFILVFLTFIMPINAASSLSWYCKRTNDHSQPTLDSNFEFIEKYNGFWCDKRHSDYDSNDKVVYLTFDAGYENGNVDRILTTLNDNNVKAAFFILSNLILTNEDLVKRMIDGGHIIGNHTSKHIDISKTKSKIELEQELKAIEDLYEEKFGIKMSKFFRPPEGRFTEESLAWLNELGYKTIMWSFAYADWDNNKQPTKQEALNKILSNIHNGSVLLLHPTSKTNADILNDLIVELKNNGFRFGDLNELCSD